MDVLRWAKQSDRQIKHAGNTETGRGRAYVCAGGARKEGQERGNTQTHVGVLLGARAQSYSQGREECGSGPPWGCGFPQPQTYKAPRGKGTFLDTGRRSVNPNKEEKHAKRFLLDTKYFLRAGQNPISLSTGWGSSRGWGVGRGVAPGYGVWMERDKGIRTGADGQDTLTVLGPPADPQYYRPLGS